MSFFAYCGSAFATNGQHASYPSPLTTRTTYANTWSGPTCYWDLSSDSGIPNNAVVTGVIVQWSTSGSYSGMHLALFKQDGNGYYIPTSGVMNHSFDGQSAKQLWSSKFWVEQITSQVQVAPELFVFYSY